MILQSCSAKIQAAADQLVLVYKRVSLDDDLDDSFRDELLGELSEGAFQAAGTLRLVTREDDRSQGEIARPGNSGVSWYPSSQNIFEPAEYF